MKVGPYNYTPESQVAVIKPSVEGPQYSDGPVVRVQKHERRFPARPDRRTNRPRQRRPENGRAPGGGANGRGAGAWNRRRSGDDPVPGSPARAGTGTGTGTGATIEAGAQRLQGFRQSAGSRRSEGRSVGIGSCPAVNADGLRSSRTWLGAAPAGGGVGGGGGGGTGMRSPLMGLLPRWVIPPARTLRLLLLLMQTLPL